MKYLDISNLPDEALIRLPLVIALTGRKRSSIYNDIALNVFPRPVKIGSRAIAFKLGDIREWLSIKTADHNKCDGGI